MDIKQFLTILAVGIFTVNAFGTNEDKFIKKYAMMKIYESCFGPEVVKQIRKEMKIACAKCANTESSASISVATDRPSVTTPETSKHGSISNEPTTEHENSVHPKPNFDPEKLHQAILAYRPNPFQPTFRPYSSTPGFYPGFANPGPMFYPGGFQGGLPFTQTYAQFPPFFQPAIFGNQRMSRDMDIKNQIEALTARMSGRVRNVTCVMQELGYLDEKLEPNYEKIQAKIDSLAIPAELKQDIQDGVTFCQKFSQCVPEVKKDKSPLSNELIRPMFFFRCYKHKKLEACVMKDVRERFASEGDENMDGISDADVELRRTGKASKLEENEIDELASSIYEFLYGSDSIDYEAVL